MSILVDTNLLLYAALPTSPHHIGARRWLEGAFADRTTVVGLTWPALYAFMRLITNRRVVGDDAIDMQGAWAAADAYRRQANTRIVGPGEHHGTIAGALMSTPGLSSNDVPDVQLAATAIEHGLELCTHDHGFARFPGLRWSNPLATPDH